MYAKNGYGSNSSIQRYRAVKIETASPAQIMLMLYDGAIRFTLSAQERIAAGDPSGKGTYIGKVQAIISELMSSLDFTVSPDLCARLQQLYIYMMEQLTEANLRRRTEPLDTVVNLLRTLRDGWAEALASLPSDPTVGRDRNPVSPTPPAPEDPRA